MLRKKDIGHEFPVQNAKVIEASRRYLETKTTAWITKVFTVAVLAFLIGAILHGIFVGDFAALKTLWAAIALPLGWVMKHYFERRVRHEQEND